MIERTAIEQQRALYFHRRRQEAMTPRRLLSESDELLFWLEECLVQGLRLAPGYLMPRLLTLLCHADASLARQVGTERRPEQLMEFLYQAQARLMDESVRSRKPARIIPLFRR